MSRKLDKKFLNLINMLDGAKKKGEDPPSRVLIYRVDRDAFEDIESSSKRIDPSKKTLLLIHGTMAVTTNYVLDKNGNLPKKANMELGSFAEMLYRDKKNPDSFLKKWINGSLKYEQVIAFDHWTLRRDVRENVARLMELLPEKDENGLPFCFKKDVDILAGSRGALVAKLLANSFSQKEGISSLDRNTKVPVGNLAFIAAGNGSHLLTFDELAPPNIGDTRMKYREGLKAFIDELGLLSPIRFLLKNMVNKYQDYIYQFMNLPGILNLRPGHIWLQEILDGEPATPTEKGTIDASTTLYFPIVGKYDSSDYKRLKGDIKVIRKNIEKKIRNFFLRLLLIHKLIGMLVKRVFKKEVDVLKRVIFKNQDSDLVISCKNQAEAPRNHFAPAFLKKARILPDGKIIPPKSIAIHSFYLNHEYLDEGISMKEKIKDFLEHPSPKETITSSRIEEAG